MTTPLYRTFYIPGYPGSGSYTARRLQEMDPHITILEYDPEKGGYHLKMMVEQILEMTSGGEHPIIAASSLGGWFAERIAGLIPVDLVLWNPSLKPNMVKYGLPNYRPHRKITAGISRTVFLGMMDDVVDPKTAIDLYGGIAEVVQLPDVGHRMTECGLVMMYDAMRDKQQFLL